MVVNIADAHFNENYYYFISNVVIAPLLIRKSVNRTKDIHRDSKIKKERLKRRKKKRRKTTNQHKYTKWVTNKEI